MVDKVSREATLIRLVTELIMYKDDLARNEALYLFISSKTLKKIKEWVLLHWSPIRCYDELHLELEGSPDWMMYDLY